MSDAGIAYKYCDAHGSDILRNLELKITPPNQFNDPFEFTPHVISSSPERELKRVFRDKDAFREMFDEDKRTAAFTGTFRQFKHMMRDARPALLGKMLPLLPEHNAEFQDNYLHNISRYGGVLCLAERRDSIVMWGHYCDKHRGIVIGLDKAWPMFRQNKGLRSVEYVRERVVWNSSWVPGGTEEKECTDQLIFRKNAEWSYEQELRILFLLRGLNRRLLKDGDSGYFVPIPPEIVMSVSFGTRCPPALADNVRSILGDPRLSHVKLDRAVLHEKDFALRFQAIK